MEQNTRPLYSQRTGKGPEPLRLTWQETLQMFQTAYQSFEERGYFQEFIGKNCPDNGAPRGRYGGEVQQFLLRKLHKRDLWPIWKNADRYSEDDLFDMIEFLYDNCSKGLESHYHSWNNCGDHYTKFDRAAGRSEFRRDINEILALYGPAPGYELSEVGELLSRPEEGFDELVQKPLPSVDPEHVDDVVASAKRKFLGRHATPSDRLDAIRDLAAALERMRPNVEKVLAEKDARDVYFFMNHFGIRHNRPDQQTKYDKEVIYEWAFYYYLATLHASVRLMEEAGLVAPSVAIPESVPDDDLPF